MNYTDEEIWKVCNIDGEVFEDYEVSTHGRVRSLNYGGHGKIQVLKQWKNPNRGYWNVTLYKNKKAKKIGVHRLVGFAFIPLVEGKTEINHIDENPENNHVSNLEWSDRKQQINHGTRTKRAVNKQTKTMRNRCGRKIRAIHLETGETIDFDSLTQAAKYFEINIGDIWRILQGEKHSRKGYTFIEIGI